MYTSQTDAGVQPSRSSTVPNQSKPAINCTKPFDGKKVDFGYEELHCQGNSPNF